jgi:hypothetical protein
MSYLEKVKTAKDLLVTSLGRMSKSGRPSISAQTQFSRVPEIDNFFIAGRAVRKRD